MIERKILQVLQMHPFEPTQTKLLLFQLNLQVLYRLFKYALCVSKRVYGIVLEPLFGIVNFLSHSGSFAILTPKYVWCFQWKLPGKGSVWGPFIH